MEPTAQQIINDLRQPLNDIVAYLELTVDVDGNVLDVEDHDETLNDLARHLLFRVASLVHAWDKTHEGLSA
jgi:hypothetical protein